MALVTKTCALLALALVLGACRTVGQGKSGLQGADAPAADDWSGSTGAGGDWGGGSIDPKVLLENDNPELAQETAANPKPVAAIKTAEQAWKVVAGAYDEWRSYSGSTLCKDVRSEQAQGTRLTAECGDFCDTFQPNNPIDKSLLLSTYASYITYLPAPMQRSVENAILFMLGRPGISQPAASALGCAAIVLSAAAGETADLRRCNAGSNCLACGRDRLTRQACRMYDTARTCAQNMGLEIPFNWIGIAARGTCAGGVLAQREIYRNTCSGACEHSRAAAAPIAQPVNDSLLCCRCDRIHYADRWIGDEAFQSDYYWSRVSDYNRPVPECEGKNYTKLNIALATHDGYPVYYYYQNCAKVRVAGNRCPADSGYHATLK